MIAAKITPIICPNRLVPIKKAISNFITVLEIAAMVIAVTATRQECYSNVNTWACKLPVNCNIICKIF
jgi:hypothetical protein